MTAHGKSDRGCVRKENEDRIFISESFGLYVVCDGMGGHKHGELAAEIAVSAINHFVANSSDRFDVTWPFGYRYELSLDANRLATGIRLANRQVWRKAEQALENSGMGTTIVALLTNGDRAVVANVGDSRAYLLRAGEFRQISSDDTMIAFMVQRGSLTSEEAASHPMRNVLTQAAGSNETLDVHIWEGEVSAGDKLLLCSDGLYGVVGESTVKAIISQGTSAQAAIDELTCHALAKGAPDNVSSILIYR